MPKAILDEFLHVTENGVNSNKYGYGVLRKLKEKQFGELKKVKISCILKKESRQGNQEL